MSKKPIKVIHKPLKHRKMWGHVDTDTRVIEIDDTLTGIDHLDTLTHEALHIGCPYLAEEAVEKAATDIARVLWREGYRRLA